MVECQSCHDVVRRRKDGKCDYCYADAQFKLLCKAMGARPYLMNAYRVAKGWTPEKFEALARKLGFRRQSGVKWGETYNGTESPQYYMRIGKVGDPSRHIVFDAVNRLLS